MPAKSAGSEFRLDGKTALVTGAGRGIGRACALALAAAGAELVLVSRTKRELDEVAAEIASRGGTARPLVLDVTRSDLVRDAVAGLGRLDILVNNAGQPAPALSRSRRGDPRPAARAQRQSGVSRRAGGGAGDGREWRRR